MMRLADLFPPSGTCPECGRKFNLLEQVEAEEWYYGHDCEV